jgi:hypothetical protein
MAVGADDFRRQAAPRLVTSGRWKREASREAYEIAWVVPHGRLNSVGSLRGLGQKRDPLRRELGCFRRPAHLAAGAVCAIGPALGAAVGALVRSTALAVTLVLSRFIRSDA